MVETTLPNDRVAQKPSSTMTGNLGSGLTAGMILACFILVVMFLASDIPAWSWMYRLWTTNPDNSHGLLVPAFSAWLLWHRRNLMKFPVASVSRLAIVSGTALILAGIVCRLTGIYTRTITLEALSILPCCGGLILILFGWEGVRWSWPAVAFLIFMIPLPGMIGGALSGSLQSLATITSTFTLQTLGIPAISEGNVIWLTEKPLGVAQACSGLRMMTSFFALAAGVAIVIERPLWEKCLIILSTIDCNCIKCFEDLGNGNCL